MKFVHFCILFLICILYISSTFLEMWMYNLNLTINECVRVFHEV